MTDTASIVLLVIMAAWVGSLLGLVIGYWFAFKKGYNQGRLDENWVLTALIARLAMYAEIKELAVYREHTDPDSFAYIDARVEMEARGVHV